jgi:uncharacterized damage-inducible protein DinB
MTLEILEALFVRDLERLKQEINLYEEETKLWVVADGITNSAGNLCLHLVGNLNTYIGAEIGKTGYIRHRELEFSLKNISRKELVEKIDATIVVVGEALRRLSEEDLIKEYPLLVFKEKTTTGYLLVHLAMHLAYHLGQINYHRRLLDE